jgi:Tol biopolymer transport system component
MPDRIRVGLFRSALLLILLAALIPSAQAQYFGRNKVQWENFDFKILHTQHFDIYYYDQEVDVVNDVGRQAERWYTRLSQVFNHQFTRKPIVLYANSADFQQTTTTEELIGEGTGGFTDPFQNRVVLPLTGDYAENDHVLGHELVHVFQFDIASRMSQSQARRRFNLENLPLWLVEGMAEYFSKGRIDPLTAMWVRDATNQNRLPDLRKLTTDPRYFPYRYGQALLAYVGGRYGDDYVVRLFLAAGTGNLEDAFPRALGVSAKQLFEDWHAAAREMYEPIFLRRPATMGEPILGTKKTRGDLNIGPALSPDGDKIAFLTSRNLFSIDLYLADAHTGKLLRKLVSSEGNAHFDALRFIDSAGSWSPDSKRLAFVVFEHGDNRLAIVDAAGGPIERIRIPGVDALANPAWSPDGHTIAFSGQDTGVTDLFLYDLDSKQVRRLTHDKYADLEPAWSPDGKTLAFVTDRGRGTNMENLTYSDLQIGLADIGTGEIKVLPMFVNGKEINPQFAPDGRSLYFIGNPEGIPDVFRYTFADGALSQVTHVATGVSGITDTSPALSVSMRTGVMALSIYENDDYNIYETTPGSGETTVDASLGNKGARAGLLPPLNATSPVNYTAYLQRPSEGLIAEPTSFRSSSTDRALHLTYLGPPTVGVSGDRFGYGVGGTVSAYYSDVLGRNNVGFTFQGGGNNTIGFEDSFGADVFYLNRENRINWGAEVSHIPNVYPFTSAFEGFVNVNGQTVLADVFQQQLFIQTNDSLSLLSQYPLNATRRVELNGGVEHIAFKTEIQEQIYDPATGQLIAEDRRRIGSTSSLNLFNVASAFVGDSSIFGFISPVSGTRYRFEGQAIAGDLKFETALADWRKYFFVRPVTLAIRALHYGRYGTDAEDGRLQQLFVGDYGLVRGYSYDSFNGSECINQSSDPNACPVFDRLIGSRIALASVEARVPLFGVKNYGLITAPFLPTELYGFADGGLAWSSGQSPKLRFVRNTEERVPVFSVGAGLRILLSYIPIEIYWAKPFQRPGKNLVFGFNIAPGW